MTPALLLRVHNVLGGGTNGKDPKGHVANVIATFKMIQKPPKLQQKLDSFVQQRET